jgi:iron complex outermembrane receptor protein
MNKVYILSVVLWLTVLTVVAQDGGRGSVKGAITDQRGVALEGIAVGLEGTKMSNLTDEKGEFFLKNVPVGAYKLAVSPVGFAAQTRDIEVKENEVLVLNFQLDNSTAVLNEVVITGVAGKNNQISYAGLKMPIPLRDVPYSVQVIDRQLIVDQQMIRIGEVARNTPGVYMWSTIGGVNENLGARGFSLGDRGMFRNGLRYNYESMPDAAGIERVEFLKGSAAVLFGQVSPGATVNIITKKPKFENGGEVSLRVGSYNFYKPSVDVYGGLGKKVAYRLNVSYENAGSFREAVKSERIYVNPSIQWNISNKTTLLFEGDYTDDNRTADYGIVAFSDVSTRPDGQRISTLRLADMPRERFLGAPFNNNKAKQANLSYTFTHKFNSIFTLRSVGGYYYTKKDLFSTGYHNTPVAANGDFSRSVIRIDQEDTYRLFQVDLLANFQTGFIKHNVLLGFDTDNRLQTNPAYTTLARYDVLNIFNMNSDGRLTTRTDAPMLPVTTTSLPVINRVGAYVQDLMSFGKYVKLLLGARYSYIDNKSQIFYPAGTPLGGAPVRQDTTVVRQTYPAAWTPSIGLVVNPLEMISVYGSYTSSFSPNSALDAEGNVLRPSTIDQIEVGVKADLWQNRLSVNAAYYAIVNNDVVQPDPNAPGRSLLGGRQDNKGWEVSLVAQPLQGLTVTAGYSRLDARYVNNVNFLADSRPLNTPTHTGNLWASYRLPSGKLKGLFVGLGAFYTGERTGDDYRFSGTGASRVLVIPFVMDSFTELDASLGYQWKRYSLMAKVSNLTNQLSYTVYRNLSINPTAPRQFALTAAVKL